MDVENTDRRGFFRKTRNVLATVIFAELVLAGSYFLAWRRKGNDTEETDEQWIDAGSIADYKPDTVTYFRMGGFFLACLSDGGFLALSMACTHLGCSVRWMQEDNRFNCPCHSSAFDPKGNVLSSPAQRPLDYFSVQIKNKQIRVNVATPLKRAHFDKNQVTYG